jgi:TatD DNase family protein
MIFDTHCHLDADTYGGDEGVDAVVATARAAGVTRMLTVGCADGSGRVERTVATAERFDGVWCSVGVHPHDAKALDDTLLARLRVLAEREKVVAWGEVGLDFFYDLSERDTQRQALRTQIRVALELGLPLIVHDRDSEGETLAILDDEGAFDGPVLYHCYSSGLEHMQQIVQRGGFISIPGIVTYPKSTEMQAVATEVPLDRLLVETDAPYLTPQPLRGARNEPCHTALTLDAVALLRGTDRDTLAAATTANALRLFGLTQSPSP